MSENTVKRDPIGLPLLITAMAMTVDVILLVVIACLLRERSFLLGGLTLLVWLRMGALEAWKPAMWRLMRAQIASYRDTGKGLPDHEAFLAKDRERRGAWR